MSFTDLKNESCVGNVTTVAYSAAIIYLSDLWDRVRVALDNENLYKELRTCFDIFIKEKNPFSEDYRLAVQESIPVVDIFYPREEDKKVTALATEDDHTY